MQAINDAEADEKMADQLVALERSMSQERSQTGAEDTAGQDKADIPRNQGQVCAKLHLVSYWLQRHCPSIGLVGGPGLLTATAMFPEHFVIPVSLRYMIAIELGKPSIQHQVIHADVSKLHGVTLLSMHSHDWYAHLQDSVPPSRHLLHNISEDSHEGHMSSNSNNSHMAASAFAAVSHLHDFDNEDTQDGTEAANDNDDAAQHTAETASETAEVAADPAVDHHVEQASSIDKADASDQEMHSAQSPAKQQPQQSPKQIQSQPAAAQDSSATPFQSGSIATAPPHASPAGKDHLIVNGRNSFHIRCGKSSKSSVWTLCFLACKSTATDT